MRIPVKLNEDGFLINPNFKRIQEKYSYYGFEETDNTLWLHSTDDLDVENLVVLDPDYSSQTSWEGRFYIGAGDNTEFGRHCLFVKYAPTKIFNGTNPKHVALVAAQVMKYIYGSIDTTESPNAPESMNFQYYLRGIMSFEVYKIIREMDFNKTLMLKEVKEALSSLWHYSFENNLITRSLKDLGFTSYFEQETEDLKDLNPYELSWLNVCIFSSDFDNVIMNNSIQDCHQFNF